MVISAAAGDRLGTAEASVDPGAERRTATRYTSLIRAAKLVTSRGEFACVVRDVSRSGAKVRLFHPLPPACAAMALELQNGDRFDLRLVRQGEAEASFMFMRPVVVERLVREHWTHPRRPFRLRLCHPVEILRTGNGEEPAVGTIVNLSQHGARVETSAALMLGQPVRLDSPRMPSLHARVRWRRDGAYGLVLERPFTLEAIALLAARIQCHDLPLLPHSAHCSSRSSNT